MYHTIIVPIDLAQEEKGRHIVDLAIKLGSDDARIVLTNVIEELPGYIAVELPENLIERTHADSQNRLEAIAAAAGIKPDIIIRTGHPGNEILDLASEMNADLIMVASHRPGLQDYFIGSTAGRVVRHANCSVMVVR